MSRANLTRTVILLLLFLAGYQPSVGYSQGCSQTLAPLDLRHCEEMFNGQVQAGTRTAQLTGGWRLVRTPDPGGGPEAVAVLHTASASGSDVRFAGVTFRCGRAGIETLLILLVPLVRGAQYDVLLKSSSTEAHFRAEAVQGGEALLLPQGETALTGGAWQATSDLAVDIAAPLPIHGAVPLAGLSGAMQTLTQNCPAH
jgi:hypothetical protein